MRMKPAANRSASCWRLSRADMRPTMLPPRRAISLTFLTLACVASIFSRLRPSSSVIWIPTDSARQPTAQHSTAMDWIELATYRSPPSRRQSAGH